MNTWRKRWRFTMDPLVALQLLNGLVEVAGKITILIEKLATEKIPSAEEISQVEEARRDAVKRMAEYAERINNAGNTPQG